MPGVIFWKAAKQPDAARGGTDAVKQLEALEAGDDLVHTFHEQFDHELLEQAKARVRERVEPHTWEAFRLTAVDGLSGANAAAELSLKVATVFKAKSKVQKMLQEEVARLEGT